MSGEMGFLLQANTNTTQRVREEREMGMNKENTHDLSCRGLYLYISFSRLYGTDNGSSNDEAICLLFATMAFFP